jgi:hypothetical protein
MVRIWKNCARLMAAMAITIGAHAGALAEDGAPWSIRKSSGEVWITAEGIAQASLTPESQLKSGDTIRTGRNGRVLLMRGEESILVSPNSVIGIPGEKKDGLSTTILQQAGSILLEVEKRNVKHFEVETPYLAAVVKGTQFRVSVNAAGTSVDVLRGQVEVADFKSGQIAQLLPGQMATALAQGKTGLTLSGSGTFNPIEQGKPRAPSIQRIMVPKNGLPAPRNATNGQHIRSFATLPNSVGATGGPKPGIATSQAGLRAAPAHNALRISSPLGEVRLNFHQVTHGLARGVAPTSHAGRTTATRDTVWSSRNGKASTFATGNSGQGNSADGGNAAAMTTSIAGGTAAAASAATATASVVSNNAGDGNGNGNGNSNGNGNGRGNNGNGGANGNGNGNGNGNNGNGNNGHGHAYGRGH